MLVRVGKPLILPSQFSRPHDIVEPGQSPPVIQPHCRRCGVPVERFTIDYVTSPMFLPVDVQCHGKTTGRNISAVDVVEHCKTGKPVWFFVGPHGD